MVKVWLAPWLTATAPLGEMLPLPPTTLAVMVWVSIAKLATMVWSAAITLVKV